MLRNWRFPAAVAVLGAVLFVIAAILGQHPHGTFKNVLGGIGWFGFLVCALVLILWAIYFGWHALRRRRMRHV